MDYLRTGDLTREEYLNLGLSIYESLAREGNIAAMYQAGRIYELLGQGEGNDRKAFRWYRSVLDRNARHPNANFRIGVFYEQGRGDLRKDIEAAFDYYEKARRGGHAIAAPKIHIKNRLGGIHAYRDLAHIKQEIQERYLAAKEKVEQEVEEGSIVPQMEKKIKRLKYPRGYSIRPALIHVNGVHEDVAHSPYFSNIIDISKSLRREP